MSYNSGYYDQPGSPGSMTSRRLTNRNTNRYSVTALFSMAAEQDVEVEDDLSRGECNERVVTRRGTRGRGLNERRYVSDDRVL